LSDDAERDLREVQAHFRLPSLNLVEKDVEETLKSSAPSPPSPRWTHPPSP
jgi:hypothetical protein